MSQAREMTDMKIGRPQDCLWFAERQQNHCKNSHQLESTEPKWNISRNGKPTMIIDHG